MARGGGNISYVPQVHPGSVPQHPLALLAQAAVTGLQTYQQTQVQEQEKAARQQVMDRQTADEDNAIKGFTEILAGNRENPFQEALRSDPEFAGRVRAAMLDLNAPEGRNRGASRVARQRIAQLWAEANNDTGDQKGLFANTRANIAAEEGRARGMAALQRLSQMQPGTVGIGEVLSAAQEARLPAQVQEVLLREYVRSGVLNINLRELDLQRGREAFEADRATTPQDIPGTVYNAGQEEIRSRNQETLKRTPGAPNVTVHVGQGGRPGVTASGLASAQDVHKAIESRANFGTRGEGSTEVRGGGTRRRILETVIDEFGDRLPAAEEAKVRGAGWTPDMVEARRAIRAAYEGRIFETQEDADRVLMEEVRQLEAVYGRGAAVRNIMGTIEVPVRSPQGRRQRRP